MNLIFAAWPGPERRCCSRSARPHRPRLDLPGAALVSASMFCLVYGFSNAATHNWHTPSTYGFLAAGVALLAAFALWQSARPARCCRRGWCSTATAAAPTWRY